MRRKVMIKTIRMYRLKYAIYILIILLLLVPGEVFAKDKTTRVSVSSTGEQGDGTSHKLSISSDSRYVAFSSIASNLVAGDNNGFYDIFVHDRQMGQTTRVSVSSTGAQGNDSSNLNLSISSDSRYVAFSSSASNLVTDDSNETRDIFVHDRQTGQTIRASVSSTGVQANGACFDPSISSDGRYVAFRSKADNLVANDSNSTVDIFVHDRQTGQTTRVSVSSTGVQANGVCHGPSISPDGRYVAFSSEANNLVPSDGNGYADIFVYDRQSHQTTRVSVSATGVQGNDSSFSPSISSDSRYVAFSSKASNLVTGDDNGSYDIFVHDRLTDEVTQVSVSSRGELGNDHSYSPSISSDNRYVAFFSVASNLVTDDSNRAWDIFMHDRLTAETTRVSVSSMGIQGNRNSHNPTISSDGRYVVFSSDASNLVPNDSNNLGDVFVHYHLAESLPSVLFLILDSDK